MEKPKTNRALKKLVKKIIESNGEKLKLHDIDVSEITDFSEVFEEFEFIPEYGSIENWNVSNGVNFKTMFMGSNVNFDFSKWNMKNAKFCSGMFQNCKEFEGKGLEYWNTENLEEAICMFWNCEKLNFDISKWNLLNLQKAAYMFANCPLLNLEPILDCIPQNLLSEIISL